MSLSKQKMEELNIKYKDIIEKYYANDARLIRQMVDKILYKDTWITDKDHYYSLATWIFINDALSNYDELKCDFNGWLYHCLSVKLKSGKTEINRQKRTPYLRDKDNNLVLDKDGKPIKMKIVSLDSPMSDEGDTTMGDMVASDYKLEDEVFTEKEDKIEKYLDNLSKMQRKIVELLVDGYKPVEIKENLHISNKEYLDNIKAIQSYENISILL